MRTQDGASLDDEPTVESLHSTLGGKVPHAPISSMADAVSKRTGDATQLAFSHPGDFSDDSGEESGDASAGCSYIRRKAMEVAVNKRLENVSKVGVGCIPARMCRVLCFGAPVLLAYAFTNDLYTLLVPLFLPPSFLPSFLPSL
jgi:hypothetical protein